MSEYQLKLQLLSDATFGRGDGVAGIIDQEVEQDQYGFPFLRGRTLKGLLREECENLIAVLPTSESAYWGAIAAHLFGTPGSDLAGIAKMQVGDACLPDDLRQAVAAQINQEQRQSPIGRKPLTATAILESLTTLRRQTAINSVTGSANDRSLRTHRVILRSLDFTANLDLQANDAKLPDYLSLLANGVLALRRVGSGRNRGRGHVRCTLWHNSTDITHQYCDHLFSEVSV
jgi:CRISPR/Cas system CSM-associated protein Csm3 (group 7 of RAMP superfamily)